MKNRLVVLVIFMFGVFYADLSFPQRSATKGEPREFIGVGIGFYNVENLFDTINDPNKLDDDFTPSGVNRWTSARYWEKIDNLSKVIAMMGQDLSPDGPVVLGVSEIENKDVLEDMARHELLRDRDYQVVHYAGPDVRGIDVAFLYQPRYFRYISSKAYPVVIEGRPDFRTRDQLLLTGELLGERMHFIVAHWPSRRGGERRSRPLRIALADLARQVIDSIQDVEPGAKVFYMGDLNDNPTDVSVRKHLRAKGTEDGVNPDQLYNPFEALFKKGVGSSAWRDTWSLFDQILLTPPLLDDDFTTWKYYKAEVFNAPFLRQSSGRFQGYPFRSYGGGVYLGGYSDHFPSFVYLIREK